MKKLGQNRKYVVFLLLVLTMVMVTVTSAAPITIDTFNSATNTPGSSTWVCDSSGIDGCYDEENDITFPDRRVNNNSSVLGGQRDLYVTQVDGTGTANLRVNQGNSGRFSYASDPSTIGRGQIVWDGTDGDPVNVDRSGLGNIDLTDGGLNNGLQLIVYFTDGGFDLTIHVMNGTLESDYELQLMSAIAAPGASFFIPFSAFTLAPEPGVTGPVNFNSVGAIYFEIEHTTPGVDLELDLFEATSNTDYGDLPALYDSTLLADNGARHIVSSPLKLGATIDLESNGFETPGANGDDSQDLDDEDGVIRQPGLAGASGNGGWTNGTVASGNGGRLDITITGGSGVPQVFIDFGDGAGALTGTLTEVTLRNSSGTALTMPLAAGTHQVYFDIPPGSFAVAGQPMAVRVRLSSAGGLTATGEAPDGEVEDYIYSFGPTAVSLQSFTSTSSNLPILGLVAVAALAVLSFGAYIVRRERSN